MQYLSDMVALTVLWHLCRKLSLCDLMGMFAQRAKVFGYEATRIWEAKLTPAL